MRHRRTKRDLSDRKLASTQTQSPEFLSKYVEWRNSRLEALPGYRKVDWWYEAMVREDIWHQWFSNGVVESETMLSRSALAHIYKNLKPKTTVTSGSTKRGLLFFRRARNAPIQFKKLIDFFCPQQLAARGLRPTSQPRSGRRKI